MSSNTIAFQGVPGANSHLACEAVYPEMQILPCGSFAEAFKAVEIGDASLGMIPIENSLGGRVADIHHLLPESTLHIIGEHFQPVQYSLLAVRGAKLENIKKIMSHPQALAQCKDQIKTLGAEPIAHADTAGAAEDVAKLGDPTIAALSPSRAGEIYGLDALRERVEDRLGNTTRFVIMSRRPEQPDRESGKCMMSLVFQVRSVPAALYKALGGFATNGVNIIKLESYITDSSFTVAQFYIEIEGHPADKPVDRALEELQYFCSKLRVLGTYPMNDFRA